MAIQGLNGVLLGNASLSVSMARSPRVSGSSPGFSGLGFQNASAQGKRLSAPHLWVVGASPPFSSSWRDVVVGLRKGRDVSSFSEDEVRMLDGVGYSIEEGTRAPVQFLFPEISRAVFDVASVARGAEGSGGETSGCLALGSARMERCFRGGLVDVEAANAEVVQGGENSFGTRFGSRGFWVNGLSFLLKGSSVGCWHRDHILSVAPSLLSVSVGVRNALRTFIPLNLFLAGLRRGSGLLESTKSFDLASSGSCAVAAAVSPLQVGSVVLPVSSPFSALVPFDGGSGVVGSALEEGCVVQQQVQLPRRRGRPKKVPPPYQSNPNLDCEEQRGDLEEAGASPGSGGPYFTRSKKTWLLGKVLGLEFEGSDIEAIRGLEKVYEDHFKT